jgi:uncharacterized protein YfaT (DUF1175 family)
MWPKTPESHSSNDEPTFPDALENSAKIRKAPVAIIIIDIISSRIRARSSVAALPRAAAATFFFAPDELRFFAPVLLFFLRPCDIMLLIHIYRYLVYHTNKDRYVTRM